MKSEKTDVPQNKRAAAPLDAFDRKILGALVRNAGLTYAALGESVGLSAPPCMNGCAACASPAR